MCMIEDFIAKNGVTQCAPAHAHGNEAKQGLRKHVRDVRKGWSEKMGVALKDGMVREAV